MEFKPSDGFLEDIVKLASLCNEKGADGMEITFNVENSCAKVIVDLTFRAEGWDGKDGNDGKNG